MTALLRLDNTRVDILGTTVEVALILDVKVSSVDKDEEGDMERDLTEDTDRADDADSVAPVLIVGVPIAVSVRASDDIGDKDVRLVGVFLYD